MTATIHYLPTARHWSAEAHDVLDAVEELLARGDVGDVITFCELAVAYLEANASDIDDPEPLVRLAERLGELMGRASTGPVTAHPSGQRGRPPSHRRGTR